MTAQAPSPDSCLRDMILRRRSVRSFQDRPVPPAVVLEVLADVAWAPSPHNSQPWRFTVLFAAGDKTRLADAMACKLTAELEADGLDPAAIAHQAARSRTRIATAPVVILCSLVREGLVTYPDDRRNDLEFQMAIQSVGAALQLLFLLAEARGLGTCWMAAPMYCPDVVRAALSLPDRFVPQALALLGFPAKPGTVKPRRSPAEFVEVR